MPPFLDFAFMREILPAILEVLPITLELTAVSMAIALCIGLVAALVRFFRIPLLSQGATFYISFIRGTPLLVQMYLAYYGIPKTLEYLAVQGIFQLDVSSIPAIVFVYFSLALNVGAYLSETIRAAIEAVDRGQMEAAVSTGMGRWQGMRWVILPQAFTIALPNLGNTLISLLKDTSLAFMVSVVEIMGAAKLEGARTLQFFEVYIVVALVYWTICFLIEQVLTLLESRLKQSRLRGAAA
ncbi:amino acid ABC transporter permease [Geomonas edaphica]|uniref:amino acid ABC transporter permease n=1 Tax=Geomonas edaphica TaxID=2570226 RepID=UPI0010A8EAE1|nr:amino acid ABC transporter permease [Geomonas edaphica]